MRKYRNQIIAVVLGMVLFVSWLWTGKREISGEDKEIYEEALGLQEQVDELGFGEFCLADYPVAMYDGEWDHVFYDGEIKRRKAVLETFAGTAYPVEDHFEVIVPTLEQFDSLMSLAGGVEGMVSGSGYGAKEQVATIWHEAFHAYQLTDHAVLGERITPEEMQEGLEDRMEGGEEILSEEESIVKEVDENTDVRNRLEKEMGLLEDTVEMLRADTREGNGAADLAEHIDGIQEMVLEYRECRRERMAKMTEAARDAEIRCELTEGTAYYVEYSVYGMTAGEKTCEERYLENLGRYEGGRGKYYRTGLAKCLILDALAPGWKETFDFTKGLDEVLTACGRM